MNVLELAQEIGLQPKRYASSKGGEYKSACPNCKAGNDRFCIWPNEGPNGRYWCRLCKCCGDAIQFCKDFFGLTYIEACKKINVDPKPINNLKGYCPFRKSEFSPITISSVDLQWKIAATQFVNSSNARLISDHVAMNHLKNRGLTEETIKAFRLGWNESDLYAERQSWGMKSELNEKGREKKQWLPKGIIIPLFEGDQVVRIKVRRVDWHSDDYLPKYVEISGGLQRPSIYGDKTKPIIIVESELDAILIQQFASDLCCCMALGGVGKKPDQQTHELLRSSSLILLSLDYDEAGKKEYPFWMSLYSSLRPWPSRKGKSPGDSYSLHQVDLRKWVIDGLSYL